jgi:UrcA family protein
MRVLFNAIALAGLVSAMPAVAEPVGEAYSVSISYEDLNVANPIGRARLKGRIAAEADRLCISASDSPLKQAMDSKQCRARFTRSAERQLSLALAPTGGSRFMASR